MDPALLSAELLAAAADPDVVALASDADADDTSVAFSSHNPVDSVTRALNALPFDPLNTFNSLITDEETKSALTSMSSPTLTSVPPNLVMFSPGRSGRLPLPSSAGSESSDALTDDDALSTLSMALPPLSLPSAASRTPNNAAAAVAAAANESATSTPSNAAVTAASMSSNGPVIGLGPYAALFDSATSAAASSSALSSLPLSLPLPPMDMSALYANFAFPPSRSGSVSASSPSNDSTPPHSPESVPSVASDTDSVTAARPSRASSKSLDLPLLPPLLPALPLTKSATSPLPPPVPHSPLNAALKVTTATVVAVGDAATAQPMSHAAAQALAQAQARKAAAKQQKRLASAGAGAGELAGGVSLTAALNASMHHHSGEPEDIRKKRLARKAELARKNRLDKKRRLTDLEKEVAELKEMLEEARAGKATAAAAALVEVKGAVGSPIAGASVADENAAAHGVLLSLTSASSSASDDERPLKRSRTDSGSDASGSDDESVAGSSFASPRVPVVHAVEQLFGVWQSNQSAASSALQTLEKAVTPGVSSALLDWLLSNDAGATAALQRVFVTEVGATPTQLSSLLALRAALQSAAAAPSPASPSTASVSSSSSSSSSTSSSAANVAHALAQLSAAMARRMQLVSAATQALQNVLSSEQLAKLVRHVVSSSSSSLSSASASGHAPGPSLSVFS